MLREVLGRQIDGDHQFARVEAIVEPRIAFRQPTVLGKGNDALATGTADMDLRIEGSQSNTHIRQVTSTGGPARPQNFMNALHAAVGTATVGLQLAPTAAGFRLIEVITARALTQVTAVRGCITQQGTGAGQNSGHQQGITPGSPWIVGNVRIGHERAQPEAAAVEVSYLLECERLPAEGYEPMGPEVGFIARVIALVIASGERALRRSGLCSVGTSISRNVAESIHATLHPPKALYDSPPSA